VGLADSVMYVLCPIESNSCECQGMGRVRLILAP
jgi:hypothetical protein